MSEIQVQVDGQPDPFTLELSFDQLTLRESTWLQRQIGNQRFDRMIEKGEIELRPDFLQALIYAKLKSQLPDLEVDGFDLDLTDVLEVLTSPGKA